MSAACPEPCRRVEGLGPRGGRGRKSFRVSGCWARCLTHVRVSSLALGPFSFQCNCYFQVVIMSTSAMKKALLLAGLAGATVVSACVPLPPTSTLAGPATTTHHTPQMAVLFSPTPLLTPTSISGPFLMVSETVNIRKGPGTAFDVVGQIPPNEKFPVIGKFIDWWFIDLGENQKGWVYGPVNIVTFVGDADIIPEIASPSTPTPEITPTCVPTTPQAEDASKMLEQARSTLVTFFELLNNGHYAEAARIYAGGYEVLRDWNPLLDPKDYAALLKNGCTINGLQCLRVRNIVEEKQISPVEYQFMVEFVTSDGSLFVRGPCCGASATDMPPQSQFAYTVVRDCEGKFRVRDLPVYVP